ncbi:MAG TPA: hypothetical protein DEF51_08895 [Myxococcales bacterium]|nr:hypothetical protein [Myxococcales bacterium]
MKAKKKAMEAELAQLEVDARAEKNTRVEELKTQLKELETTLEKGWDDLNERAAKKLNEWLS